MLLGPEARNHHVRAAFATHDKKLIDAITAWGAAQGIPNNEIEFQMLLRNSARGAGPARRRGLSQRCSGLLRLLLVPVVHAPARRTAGERAFPRPQSVRALASARNARKRAIVQYRDGLALVQSIANLQRKVACRIRLLQDSQSLRLNLLKQSNVGAVAGDKKSPAARGPPHKFFRTPPARSASASPRPESPAVGRRGFAETEPRLARRLFATITR